MTNVPENREREGVDELRALEPLPDDPKQRLAILREGAHLRPYPYEYCPECGVSLDGRDPADHALTHWPPAIPAALFSELAEQREGALYSLAGVRQPRRR